MDLPDTHYARAPDGAYLGFTFEDAGEHELKGVPDRWHLSRVTG